MENVRHHWSSQVAALEGVDDLKEALRRADEALVRDDHAAALDADNFHVADTMDVIVGKYAEDVGYRKTRVRGGAG